jgi:hypothetical protein
MKLQVKIEVLRFHLLSVALLLAEGWYRMYNIFNKVHGYETAEDNIKNVKQRFYANTLLHFMLAYL